MFRGTGEGYAEASAMNELGGLLVLALLVAIIAVGGLLLTSHAVLYREDRMVEGAYFTCTYFTGLRSVTTYSTSPYGCDRFVDIGQK